ncbi:hypothetical protein [Ruminococcus albus]|uniref:Lipoprotein n=1 Tax=Ruminococcus albus TaxID=1264 RepID=A0A1H7K5G1_RUMAL|nr:hypothetical protein [Ruminococcus albus]SEK81726.1 hypothetical protein SAMN05216469_10658 [Ruminococcus albus]
MKKFIALSAAAVMALTMTGCGTNLYIDGTSDVYSAEELASAANCITTKCITEKESNFECQFMGDISYSDTAKYVKIYKYKNGEDTNDISGDYLTFRVKMRSAKTPSNIIEAIADNPFDIEGFQGYFGTTVLGAFIVENDENGDWKYICDCSAEYDYENGPAKWESDIYNAKERTAAAEAMEYWFDHKESFEGELLDIRYVGDESASQEELDKLNKSKGTEYDGCMKMHADLYSAEKADIVKDTEWLVARQNGEWEVVECDLPEASKAE